MVLKGRWSKMLGVSKKQAMTILKMNPKKRHEYVNKPRNKLEEDTENSEEETDSTSQKEKNVKLKRKSNKRPPVKNEVKSLPSKRIRLKVCYDENESDLKEETEYQVEDDDLGSEVETCTDSEDEKPKKNKYNQTKKSKSQKTHKNKNSNCEEEESEDNIELSEYEKIRRQNVELRMKMFQELQLNESKIRFDGTSKSTKDKKNTFSKRGLAAVEEVSKKKVENVPSRKSLRLQNVEADTGLSLPEKEPSSYNIPYYDDNPRPPLRPLLLDEITSSNFKVEDSSDFLNNLAKNIKDDCPDDKIQPSFGKDVRPALASLSIKVKLP
jgi:hypothetical protein